MIPTLEWTSEGVRFLDQTRLPLEEEYVLATTYKEVATVITTMVVRGAPAIGVSAAMGVALGVKKSPATTLAALSEDLALISSTLASTRPTAVNLFWAIDRMNRRYRELSGRQAPHLMPSAPAWWRKHAPCMTKTLPPAAPSAASARSCYPPTAACSPTATPRPGDLRLRHSAWRHPRSRRVWPHPPRLRRRDASLPAGRAPYCLGVDARQYPHHGHL